MIDLEKNSKYLPIGSVVLCKDATKRLMITGFCCKDANNPDKTYDYSGCLYPEGIVSSDRTLLFDHSQIEKIFALGYSDDEEKEFKENLINALDAADND